MTELNAARSIRLKLHLRDERTDRRTKRHVSVRPSVRFVCQGRPSYGGTKRDASYKFKGDGLKIRDQPIHTKLAQLIIWKILPPDVTF